MKVNNDVGKNIESITFNLKKKSKGGFFRELQKNKALFIMTLPAVILLFIFSYLPMAGILIAFKDFRYHGTSFIENFMLSKWVGFKNFEFFLKTPDAWLITKNTVLYNLAFIILGNIVSIFLAIGLNELRSKKLAKFYQSSIMLPYFLSWIVISYLVFGFLSMDKGVINKGILEPLGMSPKEWYLNPSYWPFILIFCNLIKFSGYNAVIYLAAIVGIDQEFYEAAVIDGASKWKQITKITIPLLKPVIIILILLGIGRIFNADFGLFYQVPMASGAIKSATSVIDTYVYNALMATGDIGMSAAAGFYQAVVGFILVLLSNKIVEKIDPDYGLF